jgi:tetratricopeptide (TPR) repeat protein
MLRITLRLTLIALVALAPVGSLSADRLVTHDNRILVVKKARKLDGGGYQLVFEAGEITCPASAVKSVEIEGDMSDYIPQNADEEKKLAQGFVKYRGKWLSKIAYETELKREAEALRKRTEVAAEHARWANAYEEETKHFLVKTNTSPELLEYYCTLLETFYSLMDQRVGINPTPTLSRTKMKVHIFKSRKEFNELTGMGGGVIGFFDRLDNQLCLFHDYQDPGISSWVALHEGTHLLTYLIEPQSWPQIWINEGVADFFGSADISIDPKKGKISIQPGRLQVERILTVQQAIKDGKYVTLERLFRTERSGFTAFEYAHAWSLVYFLNNSSEKYKKGFNKFFNILYTLPKGQIEYTFEPFPSQQGNAKIAPPEEVRRVLLECLGVKDVAKLEQEWLEFIKNIEIDGPEARFRRGYFAVRMFNRDEFDTAKADLDAAIAGGFEDARAYWARGTLRRWKGGGRKSAQEDFRKAVELDALNASYRYDLAQTLCEFGFSVTITSEDVDVDMDWGDIKLRGSDDELEAAKRELGLAAELDPENDFYRDALRKFLEAYERKDAGDGGQ